MKKIVVFPSEPMQAYLDLGLTYEYFAEYFNPGGYFDEVYALSPWGDCDREIHANVTYIKCKPKNYKKVIKEINPNVIRAYGGYHCADWLAMNMVEDIPTIVSVHDTNPNLIFDSIKYADNVVYMAECVKTAVKTKVSYSNKCEWVMGNRIDTDLFSYTMSSELNEELDEKFGKGKHILHVGRKSPQKNIDTVIKALKYLPDDVSAVFVGKGEFGNYAELAKQQGVSDRVFNVDHVNNTDLPKWYSWCDCFCTPSRWEGFGFVFIEAASCKTPIVTSDIGPMNEYLTDGEDSVLVKDYENPEKVAEAISSILENDEFAKKIGEKAREMANGFSKEAVDAQEIDIYKKVIEKGPIQRKKIPFIVRKKLEWKYRKI